MRQPLLIGTPYQLQRLFSQSSIQAGDTIANTAVKTAFATTYTLPASTLKLGDELRMRWTGLISGTAVTGPIPTFEVQEDGAAIVSDDISNLVASASNVAWFAEANVTVQEVGATGDLIGMFELSYPSAAATMRYFCTPITYASFNTEAANVLGLAITFSAANAANTITQRTFTVDLIKA